MNEEQMRICFGKDGRNHIEETRMPGVVTELTRIEDLTRREFLSSALAAALLVACGDDGDGGADGDMRSFTDSTGSNVAVPVRPKRIVALNQYHAGAQILSLGGALIGLNSDGPWPEGLTRHFDFTDVAPVSDVGELDVEAIINLKPDLIVTTTFGGEISTEPNVVERLRAIAPLVAIDPYRPVDAVIDDYAELLSVERAVVDGQRQQAEAAFGQIRDLPGARWADVTAGYMMAYEGEIYAYSPSSVVHSSLLTRAGARWFEPGLVAERSDNGTWEPFSLERVAEFDCDLLIYAMDPGQEDLSQTPVMQSLRVVQAGQLVTIPDRSLYIGQYYQNYTDCATDLLERLKAIGEIRADIL